MRKLRNYSLFCLFLATMAIAATPSVAADTSIPRIDGVTTVALDGTDVYYTTARSGSTPSATKATLWRQSLVDGGRKKITRFTASDLSLGSSIHAGGGVVTVEIGTYTRRKILTKVVRFNRDGGGRKVLGTGSMGICGTSVSVKDVAPDGSVVLAKRKQLRSGKGCGKHSKLDQWRYVAVSPSGLRRTFYAADVRLSGPFPWSEEPLAEVRLNGDLAVIVKRKTSRVMLKNLATGTLIGPFLDSATLAKQEPEIDRVSLAPNGKLLITSYFDIQVVTDVFPNPLDPRTAVRSPRVAEAQFCGTRLIATESTPPDERGSLVELDPDTLTKVRDIAPDIGSFFLDTCSSREMVLSKLGVNSWIFRVIPMFNAGF